MDVPPDLLQHDHDDDILEQILLNGNDEEKEKQIMIGFPQLMQSNDDGAPVVVEGGNQKGLHGSTKAAAKRRLAALKRSFQKDGMTAVVVVVENVGESKTLQSDDNAPPSSDKYGKEYSVKEQHAKLKEKTIMANNHGNELGHDAKCALEELEMLLNHGKKDNYDEGGVDEALSLQSTSKGRETFVIAGQAAFSGTMKKRPSQFRYLPQRHMESIPFEIRDVLGLQLFGGGGGGGGSGEYDDHHDDDDDGATCKEKRKLYSHQVKAVEAVLDGKHTLVCTGTGSGKSMCFLLPILAHVMKSDMAAASENRDCNRVNLQRGGGSTAIIMYPTKALAQDQLTKLFAMVRKHPLMEKHIRPGIIDGDVSHEFRADIIRQSNIILSNPDTLHAAIIPQWKNPYRNFLSRLRFLVIDELHTYEGAFGAHVSLVLSRLMRVSKVAQVTSASCEKNVESEHDKLIFIGCSATIGHPEDYFRLLCPISQNEQVVVVAPEDDGSPCAAKVNHCIQVLLDAIVYVYILSWLFAMFFSPYKAFYCLESTAG